jgi:DNA-binding LytR/AlgR family response regulator
MKILIIEDELPAAQRLNSLLKKIDREIEVIKMLDGVESAVNYLRRSEEADLIFMDIQLSDGLSFDIFNQINITSPVIFTTAFDQYALKAFKVNSVDYLLKPIDENELVKAIRKYKELYRGKQSDLSGKIQKIIAQMNVEKYKERILIKRGQQFQSLDTKTIAYCFADGKLCYAVDFESGKYLLENNLGRLEEQLAPDRFYRINRHLLINIDSIKKIHTWLGGRLKVELHPPAAVDCVVSRERVEEFKTWLGQ